MNEITRIHIAKTAYDIEVAAKKQLEKYIKSLETYTQDAEVLADIEIRMTEILAERSVMAGGVIGTEDVAAVRAQLGEPYEFADGEGDIALGASNEATNRRLYRSTDNAVLGGILSGFAAYFNVNPVWTRLVFILLLFISFGFAAFVYILLWIIVPAARTATEKLQLTGREVTVESIKALNASEERAQPNRVAPLFQNILTIGFGSLAALAAIGIFIATIALVVAGLGSQDLINQYVNSASGLTPENNWIVYLLFWLTVFGLFMLSDLFALIAYALFRKKVTKPMVLGAVVVVVLGLASAATVIGVSTTQSLRVASESRSLVRETKAALPSTFAQVKSVQFATKKNGDEKKGYYFPGYVTTRYVVDDGPARYELSALPTSKLTVEVEGERAIISLEVPDSFRNAFVQPTVTIYGPALQSLNAETVDFRYDGLNQKSLTVTSTEGYSTSINGSFDTLEVKGSGGVDLSASTIKNLVVSAEKGLSVNAGTVRDLTITQPDVCPSNSFSDDTNVTVADVTSKKMMYNGQEIPAKSQQTSCASITIELPRSYGYSE